MEPCCSDVLLVFVSVFYAKIKRYDTRDNEATVRGNSTEHPKQSLANAPSVDLAESGYEKAEYCRRARFLDWSFGRCGYLALELATVFTLDRDQQNLLPAESTGCGRRLAISGL